MGGSFVAKGDSTKILEVVEDCYRLGGLTVEEVIEVRRMTEPVILELACQSRNKKDLQAMHKNLEETGKVLADGRMDRDKQLDFHRLIAASCHNRLVNAVMNAVLTISREFTALLPFSLEDMRMDHDYNRRFFECLEARNVEEARKLMMGHFELSREMIERYRQQQDKSEQLNQDQM